MENSNVKKLSFGVSLITKLSSLVMVALHLYCFLAFFNGVIGIGGPSGSIIGFANGNGLGDYFDYVIDCLSVSGVGFFDLILLYMPVLHIALLIVALVNFINAFIRFFKLFGGGENKLENTQRQTFLISKKLIGSGMGMLVFIMIARMFSGTFITAAGWLVIAAISLGIIVSRFVNAIVIKAPFTTVFTQIIYSAVMIVIVGMIMACCPKETVDAIAYNFKSIELLENTKSIIAVVLEIASKVLFAVVMLNTVLMVRGCKSYALVPNKRLKKSGINVFVLTLVGVALLVVEVLLLGGGIKDAYELVIKGALPMILAVTAALFFGLIQPKLAKAEKEDEDAAVPAEDTAPAVAPAPALVAAPAPAPVAAPTPAAEPEPEPEPKIVFVGKKVKKIKSKTYRNRKDINVIVIPESVVYVEGYSFYGCTELKEIHCERKSQTRFWHKKWNFGCPAKVVWNSAEESED